jgi:hypothetical protein
MSDHASRHGARIADLEAKLAAIAEAIAMLPFRRKQHALAAVEGDADARRQIEQIDTEGTDLQRQLQLTSAALEEAERLDRQHMDKESAIEKARREAEAKKIGSALITANIEIDAMLVQVREAFERRERMINELRAAGGCDARQAFRLASREAVSAAFYAARLHQHAAFEPVGVQQIRPLASANKTIPHV